MALVPIVHFKRLGSRVSHDSFNQYFYSFQNNVYTAKQMQYTLEGISLDFFVRRFLNLFHEYRNVNGTL